MLILARCAGEWDQYRFLPIDSATAVAADLAGEGAAIQKMGAGQLDLGASLRARAAVVPATLSLGNGADERASLRVKNLGSDTVLYSLSVEPRADGHGPVASVNTLEVAAGEGGEAAAIPLLAQTASGRRNGQLRNAIYFRVTDAAGEGEVIGTASLDSE